MFYFTEKQQALINNGVTEHFQGVKPAQVYIDKCLRGRDASRAEVERRKMKNSTREAAHIQEVAFLTNKLFIEWVA